MSVNLIKVLCLRAKRVNITKVGGGKKLIFHVLLLLGQSNLFHVYVMANIVKFIL